MYLNKKNLMKHPINKASSIRVVIIVFSFAMYSCWKYALGWSYKNNPFDKTVNVKTVITIG